MMTTTIAPEVIDVEDQMTAKATKPQNPAGQWWKVWVLLTSVGVTVFGWLALPTNEPATVADAPPPQVSVSADNFPGVSVERVGRLRGAPVKPVFQAPVTRTRRS